MSELTGSVVFVTGAGSGIGRAAVSAFSAAGAHVLATGRSADRLEETIGLAKDPELVTPVLCDVTNPHDVSRAVGQALSDFGRLDCAFNNAGTFGRLGRLHEDDQDNFDLVVDTNLRGLWLCLKYQIPVMVAQGGGSIVNCASVAGHYGNAATAIYSATKHAVIGLSKSAAMQYAAEGVRVNVVSPGGTETDMLRALYGSDEALQARALRTPLQRLASPEEVANAAVWLASPLASYVTGQALVIDGGVTAGA
jgi:NAD(P)-dependent dehydrogenase (short-subunit alcohol dehydrogenase family)